MPPPSPALPSDTLNSQIQSPRHSQGLPANTPSSGPRHIICIPRRPVPQSQSSLSTTQRSSTPSINPSPRGFRAPAEIGWDRDGTHDQPSSGELLLQWMEHPGEFDFYNGVINGGNQSKGALKCSEWLKRHNCPTARTPGAIQRKVPISSPSFPHVSDAVTDQSSQETLQQGCRLA